MAKLLVGINDLATLHPEVAEEADGWDPSSLLPGSNKKMPWTCNLGHSWKADPYSRTGRDKTGCPYCANKKVLNGFNDLKTRYPKIAAQADGWDPTTVLPGTMKRLPWKCNKEHTWTVSPNSRTNCDNGCPYCGNKKLWVGFNDLKTLFPEIAAEADGWDPSTVLAGTKKKMPWRCKENHTYKSAVNERTGRDKTGCPYCAGRKLWVGFNDLKTLFPEIAKEADGWDPSTVLAGGMKRMSWVCKKGHNYQSKLTERTAKRGSRGCPYCAGKKVWVGFNDLKSLFPDVAKEADGWDPSTITAGSHKSMTWKCTKGHTWKAVIENRAGNGAKCPYCAGKKLLVGFNDLKTRFPEIAKEADGWDPSILMPGTQKIMPWKCDKGHKWIVSPNSRTGNKSGCPTCAESGYNPLKPAWFYLMKRPGEQQLGITNDLPQRMKYHASFGWQKIEATGPHSGQIVADTEKALKRWLRKEIGLVKGTTENWCTSRMEVHSLTELKEKSGIETSIF